MKILMINGASNQEHPVNKIADMAYQMILEEQLSCRRVNLWQETLHECISCGKCHKQGKCIFDDIVTDVCMHAQQYDGILFLCPVIYGHMDHMIATFVERMIRSGSVRFATKPASIILSARKDTETEAYQNMMHLLSQANMMIAASQYQGMFVARNQSEVENNPEGKEVLRSTVRYLTWICRCIEKAEIDVPEIRKSEIIDYLR